MITKGWLFRLAFYLAQKPICALQTGNIFRRVHFWTIRMDKRKTTADLFECDDNIRPFVVTTSTVSAIDFTIYDIWNYSLCAIYFVAKQPFNFNTSSLINQFWICPNNPFTGTATLFDLKSCTFKNCSVWSAEYGKKFEWNLLVKFKIQSWPNSLWKFENFSQKNVFHTTKNHIRFRSIHNGTNKDWVSISLCHKMSSSGSINSNKRTKNHQTIGHQIKAIS